MNTDLATVSTPPPKKPEKAPKITAKVRTAISIMVWEGLKRGDAAQKAGLKDNSLYVALRKPDVRALYVSECETLRLSGRARRIHRLDELAEQDDNRNAAVAAIRVAEGLDNAHGTNVNISIGIQAGYVIDLSDRTDDQRGRGVSLAPERLETSASVAGASSRPVPRFDPVDIDRAPRPHFDGGGRIVRQVIEGAASSSTSPRANDEI